MGMCMYMGVCGRGVVIRLVDLRVQCYISVYQVSANCMDMPLPLVITEQSVRTLNSMHSLAMISLRCTRYIYTLCCLHRM